MNNLYKSSGLKWLWSVKNELMLVTLALVAFYHLAGILRKFDPAAAPLDLGVLSAPAVGIVCVIASILLFWLILRVVVPFIDDWFDGDDALFSFERDFRVASPAVRLCLFFALLISIILAVALVAIAKY